MKQCDYTKTTGSENWVSSDYSTLKVSTIRLLPAIYFDELRFFRGALNKLFDNQIVEMHNHEENGRLRYGYPLIQYHLNDLFTNVVGINNGIKFFYDLIEVGSFHLQIGKRSVFFDIVDVPSYKFLLQPDLNFHPYLIRNWVPFNQKNKAVFQQLKTKEDKILFLEKILTGNIMSMAKGVDVTVKGHLEVMIEQVYEQGRLKYKGVEFDYFTIKFKCNMALPNGIGLGRGVSNGHGLLQQLFG